MKDVALFLLLLVTTKGVFGVDPDAEEAVSLKEGDSVTLHTGLTEIQRNNMLEWSFGDGSDIIAIINRPANMTEINDDVLEGKFRDRLKLDGQTGDLTITNTRIEHSGRYEITNITTITKTIKKFIVNVVPVEGIQSVMEGDSVTLNTGVTEIQRYDVIKWMFEHHDSPIAKINRKVGIFSTFDVPDERFRDRLKVDHQTGSLTITNIRTQHAGDYRVDITSSSKFTIHKTFTLAVTGKMSVSVIQGDSVTLHSDTELQTDDSVLWMFGDTHIAERNKTAQRFLTHHDVLDGRFRDRLELDHQTGSLTIKNTRTTDSGEYKLQISSRRRIVHKKITVAVNESGLSPHVLWIVVAPLVAVAGVLCCLYRKKRQMPTLKNESVPVKKGDSVTLDTEMTVDNKDDLILWEFGDFLLAKVTKDIREIIDGVDESFRSKLKLDGHTGSLIITNITADHAGVYVLKMMKGVNVSFKLFTVSISDEIKSVTVKQEECITLDTGADIQKNDLILWMFGDQDNPLAQITWNTTDSPTYYDNQRFRGRLKLNKQTGSLTIMNIRTEHAGLYKLQITSHGKTSSVSFIVSVSESTANSRNESEEINRRLIEDNFRMENL